MGHSPLGLGLALARDAAGLAFALGFGASAGRKSGAPSSEELDTLAPGGTKTYSATATRTPW